MSARSNRARRRKFAPLQKQRERTLEKLHGNLRSCCLTTRYQEHLPDCERQPGRCRDKVGFADHALASARVRELRPEAGVMSVYRCRSCRLFHIGHPRPGDEA